MIPFLNCYVFSLFPDNNIDNFYFIEKCYSYNSLENKEYKIPSNHQFSTQVPDFLIEDKELLDKINFKYLHENEIEIPVIRRNQETWRVDLKYYDELNINI